MTDTIGIVRWITVDQIERDDQWRAWLTSELHDVMTRERGTKTIGDITIREANEGEFTHAATLRPDKPARLFVAEIDVGTTAT